MSDRIRLSVENEPDGLTRDTIESGLEAYNVAKAGPDPSEPVWIVARDGSAVVGGLKGGALWTWFYVDWLWVSEPERGRGLGSRLLQAAEESARVQGCAGLYLNTFSFQAPEFYRRHGFAEFGRLEDFPPGHARIWMRKTLA